MNDDEIKAEALRILQLLIHESFNDCAPLRKSFESLPNRMGIYAVRHRQQGVLYIGKAANLRYRFAGGHKALVWAFIDRLDPDDLRIAFVLTSPQWRRSQLEIETLIIQAIKPRYNSRIRAEE
jgi:excinuclease UvrABC nuclease subunit